VEDGARESLAGIFFCKSCARGRDSVGNAQQLAAEVFFQADVNDLLAVAQILGPDKPTTVLTGNGLKCRATA
jgi:hypothetical protein